MLHKCVFTLITKHLKTTASSLQHLNTNNQHQNGPVKSDITAYDTTQASSVPVLDLKTPKRRTSLTLTLSESASTDDTPSDIK